jgi:C4-dicarboxylate-specific signal transduction histidine kinase
MPAAWLALGILLGATPFLALCLRLVTLSRRRRGREAALRAAFEARLWEDHVERSDPQESDPEETRRRRHEANNALSTALLSAQFLLASQPSADQQQAARELVDALQRLRLMIGHGRSAATTTGPRAPLVSATELLAAVTAAAGRARAAHPGVKIEVTLASPALERARVAVCAGGDGLARVLDALLQNSCEGDGARAASRVAVRVGAEGEVDVVSLEIADDGPGFSAEQLAAPSRAFATTKQGRLGLGLYTAERILFASGGSLRRDNAPAGGARLTVFVLAALASQ